MEAYGICSQHGTFVGDIQKSIVRHRVYQNPDLVFIVSLIIGSGCKAAEESESICGLDS